jgi:prefoldin subunit 5
MNMRSALPVLPLLGCCALIGSIALGCAQNLADDPAFKKQAKQIETLTSDLNVLGRKLASLSAMDTEFQQVSKDVQALKAAGPAGSNEAVQTLQQRLVPMENSLKTLTEAVTNLQQKTVDPSKLVAVKPDSETKAGGGATPATSVFAAPAKTTRLTAAANRRSETAAVAATGGGIT